MLTIRDAQLTILRAPQRERFIDAMCQHLRHHFQEELAALDDNRLKLKVSQSLKRAATYGVTSQQDSYRYLNLAATYGWEFDQDPDLSWMQRYLTDPHITHASERLNLLVDQCIYRIDVEAHNRQLQEEFGMTDSGVEEDEDWGDDDWQAADDSESDAAPLLVEKPVQVQKESDTLAADAVDGIIEPHANEPHDTPWQEDDELTVKYKETTP